MDSGFCVLKGLIELQKRGVYGSVVIKKRKYWPQHCNLDRLEIKKHFQDKEIGAADCLPGTLALSFNGRSMQNIKPQNSHVSPQLQIMVHNKQHQTTTPNNCNTKQHQTTPPNNTKQHQTTATNNNNNSFTH